MSMITDRDICMATATKNKPASDITVWETVSGKAHTCQLIDDAHTAMDIMKREKSDGSRSWMKTECSRASSP